MNRRDLQLIAQTRASLADGSARLARLAAGVSVTEVAAVNDVSPQAVSQWESGRRRPSAVHTLGYARTLAAVRARAALPAGPSGESPGSGGVTGNPLAND